MPLDKPEVLGTEINGSKNKEYCIYCYKDGAFTDPGLTLGQMKELVKKQMQKMDMDAVTMAWVESNLPYLERWRINKAVT